MSFFMLHVSSLSNYVFFVMIMIAPNSLVRQKEKAQGEEETWSKKETPTPGADAPIGPTRSGVTDARNRRKLLF